jgi:hypothetical protein
VRVSASLGLPKPHVFFDTGVVNDMAERILDKLRQSPFSVEELAKAPRVEKLNGGRFKRKAWLYQAADSPAFHLFTVNRCGPITDVKNWKSISQSMAGV